MIEKLFYNTLFALFFIAVALWLFVMIGCVFAIKANAQTAHPVGLKWDAPSQGADRVEKYVVLRKVGWRVAEVGSATECAYIDLLPIPEELTKYEYFVVASYKDEKGDYKRTEPSNSVFVEVGPEQIPTPVPTATPMPNGEIVVSPPLNLRVAGDGE